MYVCIFVAIGVAVLALIMMDVLNIGKNMLRTKSSLISVLNVRCELLRNFAVVVVRKKMRTGSNRYGVLWQAVKVIVFGCGGGGESFGCESSYVCVRERCDGCGSESNYAWLWRM